MSGSVAEAILSAHSGVQCHPGDLVGAEVDLVYVTDGSAPSVLDRLENLGTRVFDPSTVALVIDHYVPAPSAAVARVHGRMRQFAWATGCLLVDEGEGISHQVLGEMGLIAAGDLVVGADSHTVTYGARGALATGVGSTDAAVAIATGRLWFRVPKSIRLSLVDELPLGVTSRDVALCLNARFGVAGASHHVVEIHGRSTGLTGDDRAVISNTAAEWDAKAAIWVDPVREPAPDSRRQSQDLEVSLAQVAPVVALPHSPLDVVPVSEAPPVVPDLCLIGTCSGGSLGDLRQAAKVLSEHSLHPGIRLLVVPASRRIFLEAIAEGLIDVLAGRGAVIVPPGCGPCCGAANGVPGDGQVVLSTANRNYRGRMGNPEARVFLGSALTVAAAAVTGRLVDPREIM